MLPAKLHSIPEPLILALQQISAEDPQKVFQLATDICKCNLKRSLLAKPWPIMDKKKKGESQVYHNPAYKQSSKQQGENVIALGKLHMFTAALYLLHYIARPVPGCLKAPEFLYGTTITICSFSTCNPGCIWIFQLTAISLHMLSPAFTLF